MIRRRERTRERERYVVGIKRVCMLTAVSCVIMGLPTLLFAKNTCNPPSLLKQKMLASSCIFFSAFFSDTIRKK